jgi:hypothetical protein
MSTYSYYMISSQTVTAAYHRLLERLGTEDEKTAIERNDPLALPSEATLMDRAVDAAAKDPSSDIGDLLAALQLAGRDQENAVSREARVVGFLRARGVPWQTIAGHRGLRSAQAAQQRYQRQTERPDLIYAFRPAEEDDAPWHGEPDLLPAGQYEAGFIDFQPATPRPLSGRKLELRYGPADTEVMPAYLRTYALLNGRRIAATAAVQLELFGG